MNIGALGVVLFLGLVVNSAADAAAVPRGSAYDSRMQQVSYNASNTTTITAGVGYVSTLVFDADEAVVGVPQVGFAPGWDVTAEANRVYIRVRPITQPVTNDEGKQVQQVFEPLDKDWKTNVFITTSKRFYSVELRVLDDPQQSGKMAFVVNFSYPQDVKAKADKDAAARLAEFKSQQEKSSVSQKLENASFPRNWAYTRILKENSRSISPDFAYDDGRFTYIGFSPIKTFPGITSYKDGKEQLVNYTIKQDGNFKVMVVMNLYQNLILRHGTEVVGVVNNGYGKVTIKDGSTISPDVERVEIDK